MEVLPPRLLLLVALCVAVRGATDGADALVVQTQYGAVRGVQSNTTGTAINAWLQIPFAADPVGPLRWMPPQPAVHWAGTKQLNATTTDDDKCFQAQNPDRVKGNPLAPGPDTPVLGSEACLTLSVWAPASATSTSKLPVVFYIFGGGYVTGSPNMATQNSPLQLMTLAEAKANKRFVVVEPNYRLGGLGFMAWGPLTKETGAHGSSGNYGTLDQIAALKWVQANIEAFGGDPSQVTIWGESAGAMSVTTLLAAPLAQGLFHRASAMSSLTRSTWLTQAVAQKGGDACAARHKCTTPACMRALNPQQAYLCTMAMAHSAVRQSNPSLSVRQHMLEVDIEGPNVDGYVLFDSPHESIAAGRAGGKALAPVPVLVGSNTAEIMVFFLLPIQSPLWNISDSELPAVVRSTMNSLLYRAKPDLSLTEPVPVEDGVATDELVARALALYPESAYQELAGNLTASLKTPGDILWAFCNYAAKGECAESTAMSVDAVRYSYMLTDLTFTSTALGVCSAMVEHSQPCYRYVFNEPSYPYDKPSLHLAVHGSNTPFAFGNLQAYYETCASAGCRASPEQLSVQQAMERYYIGFITSGDPNAIAAAGPAGVELPQWPAAGTPNAQTQQYMMLQEPGLGARSGFRAEQTEFWAAVEHSATMLAPPPTPLTPTPPPTPLTPTPPPASGSSNADSLALGLGLGLGLGLPIVAGLSCFFTRRGQLSYGRGRSMLRGNIASYNQDGANPTPQPGGHTDTGAGSLRASHNAL
eukprot:g1026.t1